MALRTRRGRVRSAALLLATLLAASVAGVAVANLRALTANSASVSAGNLAITDSDGGAALFTLSGLRPGDGQTRCINVTNTGDLGYGGLELDASLAGTGLGDYLDVDVDRGTGAAAGAGSSCTGFTQTAADLFVGKLSDFEAASPVSDPTGASAGQVVSYRVAVTLPSDVALAAQGKSAQLALAWVGVS